jgi:chromosome segregation ATPase
LALVVAIRGAERATDWPARADADAGPDRTESAALASTTDDPPAATEAVDLRAPAGPREVTARDVDVLRTRLELLHDMADGDRKAREAHRISLQADLAEAEQRVLDVQRDHRGIRQSLGDLAAIVNRQMADGSATRAEVGQLRATVLEVRAESRSAIEQTQRDLRRSVDQIEAHARMDRDWIGATQTLVERLAEDLARQDREAVDLREAIGRADAELLRQRATELEHIAVLREQLAGAVAMIEELGATTKLQAGQITRLRADLKKATAAPKAAATKSAAPKATATTPAARKATGTKAAASKAAAKQTPATKTPAKLRH